MQPDLAPLLVEQNEIREGPTNVEPNPPPRRHARLLIF
jgi:hypothetical protein